MSEISYNTDIIKDTLAKNKHFSEAQKKEFEKVMEHVIDYIVKEAKNPQVTAIKLPNLGILYRNLKLTYSKEFATEEEKEELIQKMNFHRDNVNRKSRHFDVPKTWSWLRHLRDQYYLPSYSEIKKKDGHDLDVLLAAVDKQNKNYNFKKENQL